MKKIFGSLLLLGLSLSLYACGSNNNNSDSKDSSKKIVWAGWSGEEDSTKATIKEMINSYNEDSDSKVSWVGWPWKDTQQQLIIRNQGSEQLDMAQVDIGIFGALADMGVLEDINSIADKKELSEKYEESALKVGQVDGKQLGMPWSVASIGMVYNPELLKAVGYNEPPKTVAEFEDCMKKLKEKNPDIIPYGLATKEETMSTDFQPWLWTFGGKIVKDGKVTIDNDKAVEATEWYKDLLEKDYIQMNMTRFDARQLFAEGKLAFYDDAISAKGIALQNGMAEESLDESIRPMARPVLNEGDEPQSAMWGHLLVVFKKSENKEAAMDFIEHIVSEEQALNYLESNGMPPVIKSALESENVKKDTWTSEWLNYSQTGQRLEFAIESNGSELNNVLVEELQGILLEQKDIDSGLNDAKSRLESALSNE
ncbi:ABC transporter substrate-binding protein [Enterococcus sp. JM9B]|uniref:ABC transporter substrate-binding protein n=1 Tax=Enterococcus sp. JM9B TaxID=1857216 RepID=UPI001374FBDC|nr:sugar ABC transporter substrate-binding protein [Enterococcus sp. JM9B]KAF1303557.1 hypothetical protein BAU16_04235 [Enterococcus sp. JM9B]